MSERTCEAPGCGRPTRRKKSPWCQNHYYAVRRYGTPELPKRPNAYERFWARVDQSGGPDACWPWKGRLNAFGYGVFDVDGHHPLAYAFAYEHLIGVMPEGLQHDHACHNADPDCPGGRECPHRACCNPWHIDPATPQENMLRSRTTVAARNAAKTACPNGHPYDLISIGRRDCLICRKAYHHQYYLAHQK